MKETGRNSPCPCGSGRKYKHCCGAGQKHDAVSLTIVRPAVPMSIETVLHCVRSGRLAEAESGCLHLLSSAPDNASLLRLAAEVSLHLKQPDLALARIRRASEVAPGDAQIRLLHGDIYQALNRPADAITEFLEAWRLAPEQTVARDRLIAACMQDGRVEDGVTYFRAALATDPVLSAAHGHLLPALATMGLPQRLVSTAAARPAIDPMMVVACSAFGSAVNGLRNVPAASRVCRNGAALDLTCGSIYLDLFYALYGHGRVAESLACMRALAAVQPDNPTAKHLIAALSGVPLERASSEYCASLFDACASQFDQRLVANLGYEVPRKLAELFRELGAPPDDHCDVLDLGCGTGLVGEAFRPIARSIVGIDLSAAMLEYAKQRQAYSRLEKADIVDYLRTEGSEKYNLVVAADVFIYLGKLDSIFEEIHRSLRVHGRLLFSVEALETATVASVTPDLDYALTITGRFAHAPHYIDRLSAQGGFVIEKKMQVALRTEQDKPSLGWLYVLKR